MPKTAVFALNRLLYSIRYPTIKTPLHALKWAKMKPCHGIDICKYLRNFFFQLVFNMSCKCQFYSVYATGCFAR